MIPHMYVWSPHVKSSCHMTLVVAPYLIWNRYHMVPHMYGWCPIPHTLYGIGILWSPYLMWNRYHMVPPNVHMVSPHVKCLHVLYDSYGPPYLIWNRYLLVPLNLYGTGIVWFPHMCVWSPYMYYMTLFVPLTLYGTGIIWSSTCTYGPPTCEVSSCLI